jgi:hypothetical protein
MSLLLTTSLFLGLLKPMPLLAQASTADAFDLGPFSGQYDQYFEYTQDLLEEWGKQWQCIFSPPPDCVGSYNLYPLLINAALLVAVGSLVFFMIQFGRDLNEGNFSKSIPELIWPVVVTLFLTPTPQALISIAIPAPILPTFAPTQITLAVNFSYNLLARFTFESYLFLESFNKSTLEVPNIVGPDPVLRLQQQAQIASLALVDIQGEVKQCTAANRGDDSPTCDINTINGAIDRLDEYINRFSSPTYGFPWAEERRAELVELLGLLGSDGIEPEEQLFRPGSRFSWLIAANDRAIEVNRLLSQQIAFRQFLEIAHIVAGMGGPLAMGASLLPIPVANRAITIWFSGFFGIGLAKIFYNLIIGIAAAVLLKAEPPVADVTWFTVFIAYVAPSLAVSLAAGGGVAVLNGLQGLSQAFISASR